MEEDEPSSFQNQCPQERRPSLMFFFTPRVENPCPFSDFYCELSQPISFPKISFKKVASKDFILGQRLNRIRTWDGVQHLDASQ